MGTTNIKGAGIKPDNSTLEFDGDTIREKDSGTTNSKLAGDVTRAKMITETPVSFSIALQDIRHGSDGMEGVPYTPVATSFGYSHNYQWATGKSLHLSSMANSGGTRTNKAQFSFILPPSYVAASAITVRLSAKMTIAVEASATVDLGVKKSDLRETVGSDLVTTGAQSCNSTSWANFDFTVTPTGLAAGDVLACVITGITDDTAGAHAGQMLVGLPTFLLSTKG